MVGLGILVVSCVLTALFATGAWLATDGHPWLSVPFFIPMVAFLAVICYVMGESIRGG